MNLDQLHEEYPHNKVLSNGWFVALQRMVFNTRIIVCKEFPSNSVDDSWCYKTWAEAEAAFDAWDGTTPEPEGWCKHPMSGRRGLDID